MTPAELNDALRTLGRDELHRIAMSLVSDSARVTRSTRGGSRWRSIARCVTRTAPGTRPTRLAKHRRLCSARAEMQGMTLPDPEVTAVARGAAELARGLVAGADVEREMLELLQHWVPLLAKV